MGIELGAVGMYGGGNFDTHPDYRHDFFYQVQKVARGVGDIKSGKATDFLDRAYEQNWWHTEDKLAELQDKFLEDDMINNTPGRGQKNYRRMEYDIEKNPNGKGAAEDRELAEERKVIRASVKREAPIYHHSIVLRYIFGQKKYSQNKKANG